MNAESYIGVKPKYIILSNAEGSWANYTKLDGRWFAINGDSKIEDIRWEVKSPRIIERLEELWNK